MNEITIGDKIYISAKRAAEITGYARDYVGQLCREGHVDAKMVGRSWYVYEPSIRAHRFGEVASTESSESLAEDQDEAVDAADEQEPAIEPPHEPVTPIAAWNAPKYTPEAPQELPELPKQAYEELLPPAEETLTDMQAAWREWFERKQQDLQTPEIESPEVIDRRSEEAVAVEAENEPQEAYVEETEEETSVPLHRIEDETVYFEPVREPEAAKSMRSPAYEPEEGAEPIAIHAVRSAYYHEIAAPIPTAARKVAEPEARIVSERVITKRTEGRRGRRSNAPIVAALIGVSVIAIAVAVIGSGKADRYLKTTAADNPIINFLVGTREYSR